MTMEMQGARSIKNSDVALRMVADSKAIIDSAGYGDLIECVSCILRPQLESELVIEQAWRTMMENHQVDPKCGIDEGRFFASMGGHLDTLHAVMSMQQTIIAKGGIIIQQHGHEVVFAATKDVLVNLDRADFFYQPRRLLEPLARTIINQSVSVAATANLTTLQS